MNEIEAVIIVGAWTFGTLFLLYNYAMLNGLNKQLLNLLTSKIDQKGQLEMIIKNIEESIITLSEDRIHLVNEPFLNLF